MLCLSIKITPILSLPPRHNEAFDYVSRIVTAIAQQRFLWLFRGIIRANIYRVLSMCEALPAKCFLCISLNPHNSPLRILTDAETEVKRVWLTCPRSPLWGGHTVSFGVSAGLNTIIGVGIALTLLGCRTGFLKHCT